MALAVGALLGYNRESHEKPAGLRTYMLVSLGTAFFVLVPIQLGIAQNSPGDFVRVIQGLVAGVGFIGGGVIWYNEHKDKSPVRGVTTAAGIWVSSALGLAAGCGLSHMVLIGTLLAWFTLSVLRTLEHKFIR